MHTEPKTSEAVDETPATLAEVASVIGFMESHGQSGGPWNGIERQIPAYAQDSGRSIDSVWAMPATEVLPALMARMAANLNSDRSEKAAAALREVVDARRALRG